MGDTHQHYEVLLVSAIFSRHDDALAWATEAMQRTWGPIALTSDAFSFADTEYYTETMGPALRKQFVAFEKPFAPERLVDAKLHTNALELEYGAIGDHTEQRPLNIDPGYITLAKLVLASTKDHAHRIYLGRGIFAEVTLHFKHGEWRPSEWTFPDYRRPEYHSFFAACRDLLRRRQRGGGTILIWLVAGSVIPSFLIACVAGFLVRHYAPRFGFVDLPGHRKVHDTPRPLGGGIAIWLGVMFPLAIGQIVILLLSGVDASDAPVPDGLQPIWTFVKPHLSGLREQSFHLWFMLGAGTLLMILGLADDLRTLDWRPRLAVEFLVAALMVWQGWKLTVFIQQPWLTDALSILWIVGLVNSFNFLDNMDGLSSGVAAIAASILAAVMLLAPDPISHQPQLFVGGFLLVLVGSLLGFLWHNWPPARLFMGDAGAYFIGFLLAMVTMTATFAGGDTPRHAILAPLCVLAVPLYDTMSVVVIRLREGRSPFSADKKHFSHRLVEMGLSKPQAVLTIYLTTATTGLGALLLYQVDAVGAGVILLMVACVLLLVCILETTGRRS